MACKNSKQGSFGGAELCALEFEIEAYNRTVPTADRREGVRAFNEKRKPRFEGE